MDETKFSPPEIKQFIAIMPVSLFSSVMGIVGLGLAWNKAAFILGAPSQIADILVIAGALVFLVLAISFIRRMMHFPLTVVAEYNNPSYTGFYCTIPIGILLISAHVSNHWPVLAKVGFWISIFSLLTLSALMLVRVICNDTSYKTVNGSWMIGMVAPILAPLAGTPLGYGEISHFCLSVGFATWLIIFPIILARIILGPVTPLSMRPTWFILIVPPMIMFIGYLSIEGGTLDFFARSLYYLGLFLLFTLILASRNIRKWPFSIAWWAFTFPLDGAAAAALIYYEHAASEISYAIAVILLALASFVVVVVSLRTVFSLFTGTLFLSSPSDEA